MGLPKGERGPGDGIGATIPVRSCDALDCGPSGGNDADDELDPGCAAGRTVGVGRRVGTPSREPAVAACMAWEVDAELGR